jgi:hypothetical protein
MRNMKMIEGEIIRVKDLGGEFKEIKEIKV